MEKKSLLLWSGAGGTLATAAATAGAIYWRRQRATAGEELSDEELLGEEEAEFDALGAVIRQLESVKKYSPDPFLTGGATALLKWARRLYARANSRIERLRDKIEQSQPGEQAE